MLVASRLTPGSILVPLGLDTGREQPVRGEVRWHVPHERNLSYETPHERNSRGLISLTCVLLNASLDPLLIPLQDTRRDLTLSLYGSQMPCLEVSMLEWLTQDIGGNYRILDREV